MKGMLTLRVYSSAEQILEILDGIKQLITIRFESNYSKFSNTYHHQLTYLNYLTEQS